MSLGKLLATGRSLAGGPTLGRYNVSESNRLPKFNAAKNPFAQPGSASPAEPALAPASAPAPAPAPTALPTPAPTPAAEVVAQTANSPFSAPGPKQTQMIPELPALTWMQRVNRMGAALMDLGKRVSTLAMAGAAKLWALTLNLLGRMKRVRRKEPQSVIPRFGKPAVQGELSLENVKVVRNDLEESDLEVVTAQTGTSTQVAPAVAPTTPNRGPVPPALKKMTNHMLGVKLS